MIIPQMHRVCRVAIVQTTLDYEAAWSGSPRMQASEAARAWVEIRHAIGQAAKATYPPQFILLPELAVPLGYLPALRRLCNELGAVFIAGLDYIADDGSRQVANQAVVLVPQNWATGRHSRGMPAEFRVGKTYGAPGELRLLTNNGWAFKQDPTLWLFDAGAFGRLAVCVCYDLLDVARPILYRGHIHHLFVVAYNRDASSFNHVCESVCRTVYCNVVVCNTGYYGGSVVLAPYYDPWRRTIYRSEGQRLASVQIVELPVADLDSAQSGARVMTSVSGGPRSVFKELPPGYRGELPLDEKFEVM